MRVTYTPSCATSPAKKLGIVPWVRSSVHLALLLLLHASMQSPLSKHLGQAMVRKQWPNTQELGQHQCWKGHVEVRGNPHHNFMINI